MGPNVVVEGLWEGFKPHWRLRGHRQREMVWALRDVSFDVAPAQMLGVVGTNGSGKTTLLRCLAGVLRPNRGSVDVHGRVASLVDLSVGFQDRDLSGHEHMDIAGVLLGLTRAEVRHHYDDIVAFSGLTEEMMEAPVRTYSAGMGLRLAFSLVVHAWPQVLLVDEVLAVGDEAFQHRCITRITEMQEQGCSVVLVSHDLELVAKYCDRVAVLERGVLKHLGAVDEAMACYHRLTEAAEAREAAAPAWGASGRPAAGKHRPGS